jgi:hypothetical protein
VLGELCQGGWFCCWCVGEVILIHPLVILLLLLSPLAISFECYGC